MAVVTRLMLFCLVLAAGRSLAQDPDLSPVREGPSLVDPREAGIGRLVPDIELTDVDGKRTRLSDCRGRPVVVCVTGRDCPVSRKYGPVLAELKEQYSGRGVAFFLVAADQPAAAALGARSSTDAFVLDGARTLAYRGAVDDQFGLGYALPKPRRRFLRDAIESVLSGTRPTIEATTAPGCELPTTAAAAAAAATPASAAPDLTYHNRISRIVQRHCLECHRAGENGPFALTGYDQVREHLATIKRVVRRGTMPPWFAEAKVGHWSNDRSLSEPDRADLLTWIDAGAPVGDERDAPVERTFVSGWKIGRPDAVFETPYAFQVPATGAMDYQRVMVQTHLPEDRWVSAVEIRPSNPAVVHHVLVFVVYPPNHPRLGEQPRYRDGLDGYFAGLVPGQGDVTYPPGVARFIPKDAVLVFQIHYTPNGTATEDRPRIGMVFSDGKPQHELSTRGAFNTKLRIPPGADNHAVSASHLFRFPARLLSFNPHSHVRGKAFRYEMVYPDGRAETVLDVPRYDFNWQTEYLLREPLDVPAGTRLKVTAWYDNSEKNPANPDPTATVRFGDQTWDEMMIGYFSGYRLPEAPRPPAAQERAAVVP